MRRPNILNVLSWQPERQASAALIEHYRQQAERSFEIAAQMKAEEAMKADEALRLSGKDNYGKPRQEFADRIAAMDEAAFLKQAEQSIWLSAYANNNHRSDYHWHADACYDEAARRGKPELYKLAWEKASRS